MPKKDPVEVAEAFMALGFDDFRTFWEHVCFVWSMDGDNLDLDDAWFYAGHKVSPRVLTIISAMHSAVASGAKAAAAKKLEGGK